MTTPRRSLKSTIVAATVVVAAGAALAVPSAAHAATTPSLPPRYERACLRIPNIELRITNVIARLNGDASTMGSLAWLQAQIDDANAKGRTQLATVLENRLKVRTQTLEVLKVRQQRLEKLAELCRTHGVQV